MTEAENDQTQAVPDGGYVSANMARENGKIWVEPQLGALIPGHATCSAAISRLRS